MLCVCDAMACKIKAKFRIAYCKLCHPSRAYVWKPRRITMHAVRSTTAVKRRSSDVACTVHYALQPRIMKPKHPLGTFVTHTCTTYPPPPACRRSYSPHVLMRRSVDGVKLLFYVDALLEISLAELSASTNACWEV